MYKHNILIAIFLVGKHGLANCPFLIQISSHPHLEHPHWTG